MCQMEDGSSDSSNIKKEKTEEKRKKLVKEENARQRFKLRPVDIASLDCVSMLKNCQHIFLAIGYLFVRLLFSQLTCRFDKYARFETELSSRLEI